VLDDFAKMLRDEIEYHDPQVICYEVISVGRGFKSNFANTKSLQELELTLRKVAEECGIPLKGFYIATIKAFAAHGKATKQEMIQAYARHYGVALTDDNECDAAWMVKLWKRPDVWPVKVAKRKKKSKVPKEKRLF
jgi:hypothetical protein